MALVKVRTPRFAVTWKKKKKNFFPGPLNRLAHTTLPLTPALGAFIGPKQCNLMIVLEMASTAGTCHWVSTAPDGIDTTGKALSRAPGASLDKAALCLPHWIEECRCDSTHLAWTPTLPNALPVGRSRTAENLPLCKFEPMWTCTTCTADQAGLPLSLASSEPSPVSLSAFSWCGASVTLDADWIALCSICSCPVLRLLSPLPLGGGTGGAQPKPTQKKCEGKCVRPRTLWDFLELHCQW